MTAREIIAALILKGVRQVDIARRFAVSKQTVHCVIYGRSTSRRIQCYIARLMGKDVDEVWPRHKVVA